MLMLSCRSIDIGEAAAGESDHDADGEGDGEGDENGSDEEFTNAEMKS